MANRRRRRGAKRSWKIAGALAATATVGEGGNRDRLEPQMRPRRSARRSAGGRGNGPSRQEAGGHVKPPTRQGTLLANQAAPRPRRSAVKQRAHEQQDQPHQGHPDHLRDKRSEENHTHVQKPPRGRKCQRRKSAVREMLRQSKGLGQNGLTGGWLSASTQPTAVLGREDC